MLLVKSVRTLKDLQRYCWLELHLVGHPGAICCAVPPVQFFCGCIANLDDMCSVESTFVTVKKMWLFWIGRNDVVH